MSVYINKELRQIVEQRAFETCEYCLIHQSDSFFTFNIDHIISLKHDGKTEIENLAYSCATCNRDKGSDLGSFVDNPNQLIRFFNPRIDNWLQHFSIEGSMIIPCSQIGKVTEKILKLNTEHRILEREALLETNSYPSSFALQLLSKK